MLENWLVTSYPIPQFFRLSFGHDANDGFYRTGYLFQMDYVSDLVAILSRGWEQGFVREEVRLTDGRVIVRGKVARRILNPQSLNGPRRADYVLYAYPRVALAVVEAKRDIFPLGHGLQQALVNAEMLDAPFAISSNGTGFLLHDRTGLTTPTERELALDQFPTYDELLAIYNQWKGIQTPAQETILTQPYYSAGTDKRPLLPRCRHQPNPQRNLQRATATDAGHGHRHRQNLHRLPNHLATLEGQAGVMQNYLLEECTYSTMSTKTAVVPVSQQYFR